MNGERCCCDCLSCEYMDYRDRSGRNAGDDMYALCVELEVIVDLYGPACERWRGNE